MKPQKVQKCLSLGSLKLFEDVFMLMIILVTLEQFSVECRKIKTKVTSLTNRKMHRR